MNLINLTKDTVLSFLLTDSIAIFTTSNSPSKEASRSNAKGSNLIDLFESFLESSFLRIPTKFVWLKSKIISGIESSYSFGELLNENGVDWRF